MRVEITRVRSVAYGPYVLRSKVEARRYSGNSEEVGELLKRNVLPIGQWCGIALQVRERGGERDPARL